MVDVSFGASFAALDDADDPAGLLEFLDRMAQTDTMRAAKREATAAMGLALGERVLDIGCGTGVDLAGMAAEVGAAGAVMGVDASRLAVEAARERYSDQPGIDVCCGVIEDLPFEDGAFDACRVDRTLQHVADPVAGLRETRRVLRPGGRLVVLEMLTRMTTDDGAETDSVAHAVWQGFWTEREQRRGWIGFLLPLLARQAGFADVEFLMDEHHSEGYAVADATLRLEHTTREAISAGRVDEAGGQAWLERLEQAAARGALHLTTHAARIAAVRG